MDPVTTQPGMTPPPSYNQATNDKEPPSYPEALKKEALEQVPLNNEACDDSSSDRNRCCCHAAPYRNDCYILYLFCRFFELIGECTDAYLEGCGNCLQQCCDEHDTPRQSVMNNDNVWSTDAIGTSGVWDHHRNHSAGITDTPWIDRGESGNGNSSHSTGGHNGDDSGWHCTVGDTGGHCGGDGGGGDGGGGDCGGCD